MICTARHCAEHKLTAQEEFIRDALWADRRPSQKPVQELWTDAETAKEDARVGLIQHMGHGITGLPPMNAAPRYKRS